MTYETIAKRLLDTDTPFNDIYYTLLGDYPCDNFLNVLRGLDLTQETFKGLVWRWSDTPAETQDWRTEISPSIVGIK
jgi:hypothetical protein